MFRLNLNGAGDRSKHRTQVIEPQYKSKVEMPYKL